MKSKSAFVSYSHDDGELVGRIATALNDNGVPLFFDRWDIHPGDSLIRKIFEEGLSKAELFLIVLTRASVGSKWVNEELDVATVRRIEESVRVIPILAEDCSIPVSLRALKWVDLRRDFEGGIRELTKIAYGVSDKPSPGGTPDYIRSLAETVGGLSPEATRLGLSILARTDLDSGREPQIGGQEFQADTALDPQEISDAVDELETLGLVRTINWLGTSPFDFGVAVPTYTFFVHFAERLPYDPMGDVKVVLAAVAATDGTDAETLLRTTELSVGRLDRAVDYLEDYGLARVRRYTGTAPFGFGAVEPTAQTRRAAKELV